MTTYTSNTWAVHLSQLGSYTNYHFISCTKCPFKGKRASWSMPAAKPKCLILGSNQKCRYMYERIKNRYKFIQKHWLRCQSFNAWNSINLKITPYRFEGPIQRKKSMESIKWDSAALHPIPNPSIGRWTRWTIRIKDHQRPLVPRDRNGSMWRAKIKNSTLILDKEFEEVICLRNYSIKKSKLYGMCFYVLLDFIGQNSGGLLWGAASQLWRNGKMFLSKASTEGDSFKRLQVQLLPAHIFPLLLLHHPGFQTCPGRVKLWSRWLDKEFDMFSRVFLLSQFVKTGLDPLRFLILFPRFGPLSEDEIHGEMWRDVSSHVLTHSVCSFISHLASCQQMNLCLQPHKIWHRTREQDANE